MSAVQQVQIRPVPSDEQVAALWLLFGAEPEAVRRDRVAGTVQAALQKTVDFEYLLEARRDKQRVGVVWGQCLPGRNANIWPPFLEPGEPESTADRLLAALDARLARAGLAMVQALIPATATDAANCLQRNGYGRLARLLYLQSACNPLPGELPATELEFVPCDENALRRLEKVIDATYAGTHDAPDLDGVRETCDVLAGYRATGDYSPDRWFFVQHDRADVGCLLLTDHPQLQSWELVYMGLIPAARGKGWGTELVRFALQRTRQAGRPALLVTVDSANAPAVAVYSRCGFSEIDFRSVWIKKFGNGS